MDAERATAELKVIRELMERPIRCSTMSGASGVIAGLVALAGVAADYFVSARFERDEAMAINILVWAGVFCTALAANVVLTRLREMQRGMPFWSGVKKRILLTILPPFVLGVGLTAAVMHRWWVSVHGGPWMPNQWGLIPAIWMGCYGLACWQVGEIKARELRWLGAAFVLAALPTAAFWQYSIPGVTEGHAAYWTLGATFGGFHIVYGIIVWARHGG